MAGVCQVFDANFFVVPVI